ncbi:Fic family protein [Cellvibrio sp. PSBB023]|uniref:Fic family protein n=1 Tax=Cellvibrio sp. PSBB023 TaxID=1945512 RepID=UPI001FEEBFF6|nr:Fic family protein [Cellvibrio sp. PSBB023]
MILGRSGGSGIYQGQQLVHMTPQPSQVARLMENLFHWLETTEAHPLIASSALHYEFEFIHPFSDGNGHMGRLWQTLILSRWQPLLAYLLVETRIAKRINTEAKTLDLLRSRPDPGLPDVTTSIGKSLGAAAKLKTEERLIYGIKKEWQMWSFALK